MITQEQKSTVRDWFAHSVDTLPKEIEKEIEAVGGENMLIQRMDVLYWVYFTREEVRMYQEVLQCLDGETGFDESLVDAAIQRKKCYYQNTLEEINSLKKSIREKESLLARDEEMLPRHSLSVEVLQEALKDYRNQKG